MELFAKLVNGWKLLTIFAKSSNLGVWQDSEDAFEFIFDIVSNILRNIRTLENDLILTLTLTNQNWWAQFEFGKIEVKIGRSKHVF